MFFRTCRNPTRNNSFCIEDHEKRNLFLDFCDLKQPSEKLKISLFCKFNYIR